MKEKLVLNQNLEVSEKTNRVFLSLKERRVRISVSKNNYSSLNKLLSQGITKEQVKYFKNKDFQQFISPLYFNDIVISENEDALLKFGILNNPARSNIIASAIPDKKIDEWCLFGAPADFALDPPKSPVHGPYIYRKLGISHKLMLDIGDIAHVNIDNIYSFGKKIGHVTKRVIDKKNRLMMIGGDHSLSYFTLKEISKTVDDILLIQFDAHSDINTNSSKINQIIYHANFVSKLVEEKVVSGVFQFGVREYTHRYDDTYLDKFSIFQFREEVTKKKEHQLKTLLEGRNVYISFDADALDPKIFPHVTTPMGNGISERYALRIIDMVKSFGCNIVGADFMEFTGGFNEHGKLFNHEIHLVDKIIRHIID